MGHRWRALLIIFISVIQFTLNWFCIVPAFTPIVGEMHVTFPQVGVIVGAFVVGYGLAHIPGGWISERYGMRSAILMGIAAESLGAAATACAPSYEALLAGRFLCGIGGAIYFGGTVGLTTAWFRDHELTLASGLVTAVAFTLGAAIGLFAWEPVIAGLGWRNALVAGSFVGLLTLAMMAAWFPTPPDRSGDVLRGSHLGAASARRIFGNPLLWLLGLSFLGGYGAFLSAAQLLPDYARKHLDVEAHEADMLGVILLVSGIPGGFIGGWAGDRRLGAKPTLLMALLMESVTLIVVPHLDFVGLEIAAGIIGGAGMIGFVTWISIPGSMRAALHVSDIPTAVGLMLTIAAVGGSVVPAIFGQIAANWGWTAAWSFEGFICLAFAPFVFFTPLNKHAPLLVGSGADG